MYIHRFKLNYIPYKIHKKFILKFTLNNFFDKIFEKTLTT